MMSLFIGSGVALVTPFNEKDEVNFEKLGQLIDYHIDNMTDAIIVCGTTGEPATMTKDEKKAIIEFSVKHANGRIFTMAGVGSNNTKDTVEMSVFAESVGVNSVLAVTPYYNKTTQNGLIAHFTEIANAINIPVVLYNVPSRTGLNLLPETVAALSSHPNIQGVKEASGDISQVAEIARLCPNDFYIYSGNDDQIVPILSLGGHGVISVVANILPVETHDMVIDYLSGNVNKARLSQLKMKKLIDTIFIETNPIPIKTAMNLLNMKVGDYRLPLVAMDMKNKAILLKEMFEYGLVKEATL